VRIGRKAEPFIDGTFQTTAGMAGALLSAGASPIGTALIAGASPLAAGLVGGAFNFLLTLTARRWHLWYDAYLDGKAQDPALVEAQLHAEAEDPVVQELVVENARALAEALTDSVVPVLARLTREYRAAKRRPDAFFRGMRRMLSDLSEDEFRTLGSLVLRVAAVHTTNDQQRWVGFDRLGATMRLLLLTVGRPVGSFQSEKDGELPWSPLVLRLFHLLDANGFSTDMQSVMGVSAQYPLVLEIDTARRIATLIA
jgi:hypothetical protein